VQPVDADGEQHSDGCRQTGEQQRDDIRLDRRTKEPGETTLAAVAPRRRHGRYRRVVPRRPGAEEAAEGAALRCAVVSHKVRCDVVGVAREHLSSKLRRQWRRMFILNPCGRAATTVRTRRPTAIPEIRSELAQLPTRLLRLLRYRYATVSLRDTCAWNRRQNGDGDSAIHGSHRFHSAEAERELVWRNVS